MTIAAFVAVLAVAWPAPPPRTAPASPRPAVFELRLAFREPGEGRRAYPCPAATCPPPKAGDLYVSDAVILSVADLSSVTLVLEGDDHGLELHVRPEPARSLGAVTGGHIGQPIAVFVDGRLQSAPTLLDRMTDAIWLSGAYSDEELTGLAHRLDAELKANRQR
jgi:hypothetical protein